MLLVCLQNFLYVNYHNLAVGNVGAVVVDVDFVIVPRDGTDVVVYIVAGFVVVEIVVLVVARSVVEVVALDVVPSVVGVVVLVGTVDDTPDYLIAFFQIVSIYHLKRLTKKIVN